MKGKRVLLILVFAAVLGAGWMTVIKAVTGSDTLEKQEELTAEADAFLAKELYVRAIPLYREALEYSTDQNVLIQEKLLEAYLAYGDSDSYIRLVRERISSGHASEEEYMIAAELLLSVSKLGEAMELVKKGMKDLESHVLEEYYEDHRYAYDMRSTKYSEVLPTGSNTLMPAFDGEKWGYVDERGRRQIDFIYDSALPFNEYGMAVVSLDGMYCTILQNGDRYAIDDGEKYPEMTDIVAISGTHILGRRDGTYSYFNYDYEPVAPGHQYLEITSNACGVAGVKKESGWGVITDSGEVVMDFKLQDIAINSLGCAFAGDRGMVKEEGKWRLIDTEGNPVGEGRYADARAPESEGFIAVADDNGKWGYINRDGDLVIDYQYMDALSFSDGLGAVLEGEDWGYISAGNELVIGGELDGAKPFHNGIAQVKFGGGVWLVTLKYRE